MLNIRSGSAGTREARRWRQTTHSCDVTVVSSDHSTGAILATGDTTVNDDGLKNCHLDIHNSAKHRATYVTVTACSLYHVFQWDIFSTEQFVTVFSNFSET